MAKEIGTCVILCRFYNDDLERDRSPSGCDFTMTTSSAATLEE